MKASVESSVGGTPSPVDGEGGVGDMCDSGIVWSVAKSDVCGGANGLFQYVTAVVGEANCALSERPFDGSAGDGAV